MGVTRTQAKNSGKKGKQQFATEKRYGQLEKTNTLQNAREGGTNKGGKKKVSRSEQERGGKTSHTRIDSTSGKKEVKGARQKAKNKTEPRDQFHL